ncbi:glycoside hydrolase family 2 TIM barrel-domain containing protein [Bacteroides sp. GM023]|uniref:glycoside hydrolase family 2 protein n=1 Tax=Bacteroides sp. GM023 TaxID=2723058 RepID=UPI00168C0879|nr:glycoside hydrolase family 2 TIM barrel-domain containing protein [Bacteroides sp. GM023]MBD3589953.1 beta-galactosidase [Bacteroides sp. GM023]
MTHKLLLSILLLTLTGWGFATPTSIRATDEPRQTINFNREWKYSRGDYPGAEQNTYDDTGWERIGLPHSFSIPYFMSKDFYIGYGWYRKQFFLSEKELKKIAFLEFDGVFQEAEIFVNGKRVGSHVGGYTGFTFDISSAVQLGQNIIAVRVNNIWKPDVAPRAGEHVFSGGIYRNVRLVLKSAAYIDWYGTQVTTLELEKNQGISSTVKVVTDVYNRTDIPSDYKLLTEVLDKGGRVVATANSTKRIAANAMIKFDQTTPIVRQPELWAPESPVLYKVVSTLYQGKKLIDRYETPFGFRWISWTADKGFFLNGIHRYFRGANVHQDHAGWGDAVTESGMRRDVRLMKEAGFDFIRGSHYPHAPAFSKACDEEGMLFWSEAPFWGIGGFRPDGYWDSSAYPVNKKDEEGFEASAMQQLAEMIRIHRNHPSIIAWSMCNEPFFSAPEVMPGVRRLLQKMVALSRQLDSTRPAAVGGVQRPLGRERIDIIGDVAGYNGDGGTIADFQNPGIPNLVSEYGSTTAERPGNYEPGWGDLQKEDAWKGRSWRSGQVIWCGFDHGSIAGSQLGKMGIIDYFRIPKRAWYWYRNECQQIPSSQWPAEGIPAKIRIDVSERQEVRADGTDDVILYVTILDATGKEISNSPSVTLKLISGPGEFPTGTSITFDENSDIRILDGKAAIEFRSYYAGTAVIEATSPGLESSRVNISFNEAPAYKEETTLPVKERPYNRFVRVKVNEDIRTFGRNNPTFSSSSSIGYPAGAAADGDKKTRWQADANDRNAYWTLDTEKGLALREINIVFPSAKAYQYKIEASADNLHWITLSDKMDNREVVETERFLLKDDRKFRFVRLAFGQNSADMPAAISEVIVKGVILE